MKVIKKTKEYSIYQKGSGRYAIKDADKQWISAEEKVKILLVEGLIKPFVPPAPAVDEPPVDEPPVEEIPSAEETPKTKAASKAAPKAKTKAAPKTKAKAAPKTKTKAAPKTKTAHKTED